MAMHALANSVLSACRSEGHHIADCQQMCCPGFAISTPSFQNFVGPGVSERASAYGIQTIRVDGGDALAVFTAVQEARRRALDGNCPCLVEVCSCQRSI